MKGFPISCYFDLWENMRLTFSLGHVSRNVLKVFCPDWHAEGSKSNSDDCANPVLLFSPRKTPENSENGERLLFLTICLAHPMLS